MSLSLKNIAYNCRNLSTPFSVVRDIFGYFFGVPRRTISLKRQLQLIKGKSLDINLIMVGIENFTLEDLRTIQYAVQFTRDSYSQVNLGIRKVNWMMITVAEAGDHVTIDSTSEAHDLTDDWNGHSGALDVFVIRVINGFYGCSDVWGPCSKDDKDMTGCVVSLNCCSSCPLGVNCEDDVGTTFAHEIGHFLGLYHDGGKDNVMGNFFGTVTPGTSALDELQGNLIKTHCFVKSHC